MLLASVENGVLLECPFSPLFWGLKFNLIISYKCLSRSFHLTLIFVGEARRLPLKGLTPVCYIPAC
jgi:hypothetical protein